MLYYLTIYIQCASNFVGAHFYIKTKHMKRKYAPYISILVGVIVIGSYLYSTYAHNEYIKTEQQKIIKERNESRALRK